MCVCVFVCLLLLFFCVICLLLVFFVCLLLFLFVCCCFVCVYCRYDKLLFADISAICGFKRLPHLNNLLANTVSTNMNF